MGGLIGGALARAGHRVTLLVRPETAAVHPRRPRVESRVLGVARELGAAGLTCQVTDGEATVLWRKLALLAPPDAMQKDAAAGRPLELDAIAGPIVRLGRRHGIDVSITEALVAMIEAGRT